MPSPVRSFLTGSKAAMSLNNKYKVVGLVALLAGYCIVAGPDLVADRRLEGEALIYVLGAACALWGGGEPVGTLRPISMRPLSIALGSAAMIWAIVMTLLLREALHKQGGRPRPENEVRYTWP